MKKILLLFTVILLFGCSVSYPSQRSIYGTSEISSILYTHYPKLYEYYAENVLDVTSVKEIQLADGTYDYKVNYRFVRYYYRDFTQRMEVLKLRFPELYEMYLNGVIDVTSIYKYVERETGRIRYHATYNKVYDYHYNPYPYHGGVRLYYRTRPLPPPRPRIIVPRNNPQPAPPRNNRTEPNRESRPNPQRVIPNNPQRSGGGGNTPSRSSGNSNSNQRSNSNSRSRSR